MQIILELKAKLFAQMHKKDILCKYCQPHVLPLPPSIFAAAEEPGQAGGGREGGRAHGDRVSHGEREKGDKRKWPRPPHDFQDRQRFDEDFGDESQNMGPKASEAIVHVR